MENLNEQEYIKDPNQLDLFAGILFTPEQEKMIADFVTQCQTSAASLKSTNKHNEQLLISNGFVKDIDFVNTFKTEIVTKEVTLGYNWQKNQFKTEVTYESHGGYIALKGKQFNSSSKPNELSDITFSVDFDQRDKAQCYSIQDQFRYIKPSTLLEKLKTHNSRQVYLYQEHLKRTDLKQNVIEKYTKLYPNTTITTEREYSKYSGSFDVIVVKFESGSYVQFRLDLYKNVEYIYKRYDAELDKMSSEELLEKFSKQVKKEGSN
jgi:hypothetical protein